MNYGTEKEIKKLTDNLPYIRKVAGWSSAELGELIGVTKQTISNIETGKSTMTKTQYIAIRTILDYEMVEHPENELLQQVVELLLNGEDTPEDQKKAEATKALLSAHSKTAIAGGALVGVGALIAALAGPIGAAAVVPSMYAACKWLKKIK